MGGMGMKQIACVIASIVVFGLGCATTTETPEGGILGVWELSKALNLNPRDAGFVQNIKLVFQPDGKMYKMGPKQNEFAERKRYGYEIKGDALVRARLDGRSTEAPFSLRGDTLVITESDGSIIHFKRRSSDYTTIPVWDPVQVPFTVNYQR
jgi:hypothetical protein